VNAPCHPRIAWIIPSADAGGIGPVAIETTSAATTHGAGDVTLIETHAAPRGDRIESGGLRRVVLDMGGTKAPASVVLDWLRDNRPHVLFTNGVSHLEAIFPYIPDDTLHVAVLHDAARRYRHEIASYARYLDGVVAVSDYVFGWAQRDLRAAGFKGVVRRIHNGTGYPSPPSRADSASELRLLFVGNIWHKGGSRLAGIAKALQRRGANFQLTVIADEASQLQRRFARVGLQGRVNVIARQSRTDLWRTYAAHDLLLMLSAGEPFGMVTIEAMGMGCVPVAYDVPSGTREIIEPGLSGLLVRPNSDAVAAAIAALAPAQLSAMSAEAARRARTLFCAERAAQEYMQLADDLVRCRDLVHRARLPAQAAPLTARSRSYSPIARLYHALPSALRHQIRNALTAYPASFRWLRERI
jgi:glycosyltransferase involved in cell wall biosynthesis